jgi:hypothetical protein
VRLAVEALRVVQELLHHAEVTCGAQQDSSTSAAVGHHSCSCGRLRVAAPRCMRAANPPQLFIQRSGWASGRFFALKCRKPVQGAVSSEERKRARRAFLHSSNNAAGGHC